LRAAQELGYRIVGADLDGTPPDRLSLSGPTVLVIGAEGKGLRRLTKELCDDIATIPLSGNVESLNAASAASILVYEASRQRRKTSLA
jgi:23S rRNA (guanosine2251-2'-O)-methyltransferase